jgi:hypothetical protein
MKKGDDQYSEAETTRRRDATLKRMFSMLPKPHKPLGKRKQSKKAKPGK